MAKLIFEEKQRFTQWWIWLILLGVFAYLIKSIADFMEIDHPSSDQWISYSLIILSLLLVLLIFAFSNLYTRIDENGIQAMFRPFSFSRRSFDWEQIEKAEIVKYHPLREYGGWGFRISFRGKGNAMNVKGNKGIRLHLKNGKQFLIGTQQPDKARAAIRSQQEDQS